ncbi:T-box transcription factor TBX21-like [Phascolarctos cinereus]
MSAMSDVQGGYFYRPEQDAGRAENQQGPSFHGAPGVACAGVATLPQAVASGPASPGPGLCQPANSCAGGGGRVAEDARHGAPPPASRSFPQPFEANPSFPETLAEPLLQNAATASSGNLKVVLCNHSLWLKFHTQQNEMILTKPGRAMFPFLTYQIHGMDPDAQYQLFVDVVPIDQHHWRYHKGRWGRYQKEDDGMPGNRVYIHPHSPNSGAHWMKREISFKKLKLTNTKTTCNSATQPILLKSLHKYQPRLHIQELRDGKQQTLAAFSSTHIFTFPETEFIAVTAYHNAEIIRLKVNHNPFATAFRKGSQPGQSTNDRPPVGEGSAHTSPEAASVDSGYPLGPTNVFVQDRDDRLLIPGSWIQTAQLPWQQTYDSTPTSSTSNGSNSSSSSSNSSTLLSFHLGAMNLGFLASTSVPGMPYECGQDAVLSLGQGPTSLWETSQGNALDRLPSVPPNPSHWAPGTQEEESLQGEMWTFLTKSHWADSALDQTASKKRCLSPHDSGKDGPCSVREVREVRQQEDDCLAAAECSCNTCPEAASEDSSYLLGLQDGTVQDKDPRFAIPWHVILGPQSPWQQIVDSTLRSSKRSTSTSTSRSTSAITSSSSNIPTTIPPFPVYAMNPGFLPSTCPPAMPYDPAQDVVLSLGQGLISLSGISQGNNMDCLQSVPPNPTDAITGDQEEESLQEEIPTFLTGSESDDSALGEKAPKKRRLSPNHSSSHDFSFTSLEALWEILF